MTNEQNVTLNLSLEEVNLVISALAELPARVSMTLINKVTGQASTQLKQQSVEVVN